MNGVCNFRDHSLPFNSCKDDPLPCRRSAVALAVPLLAVVEKARKAGLAQEYGKISEVCLYWTNM